MSGPGKIGIGNICKVQVSVSANRLAAVTQLINRSAQSLGALRTEALIRGKCTLAQSGIGDSGILKIIDAMKPYTADVEIEIGHRGGRVTFKDSKKLEAIFEIEAGFKLKLSRDYSQFPRQVAESIYLINPEGEEIGIHYGFADDHGYVRSE